jgi:hypothetical protein
MLRVVTSVKAEALMQIRKIDRQIERLRRRWVVARTEDKKELMDIIDAGLNARFQFMILRDG